jgi:long-chain fatty acid transport protein
LTAAFSLLLFSPNLWALNGAQLTGFTAIHESLGGTGVAWPQDTSTLLVNPAGLTRLPRLVNFNLFLAWPKSQMDTSAAPAGNAAGLATSDDDPVVLPGGAFNFPTPWLGERIFIGAGILPVAGFSVDYPSSRLSAAITGNAYDTHTFYGLFKIVPAAAFRIDDRWSVGLAVHIDHAQLETNSAVPGTLAETAGTDRGDGSFGIGVGIGVLYQPFDFLSAGLSYTTEQWMQEFERYQDLLPAGLNFPQQLNVGLSVKPIEKLLVNTDFRWINWSGAGGAFGTPVAAGGLGWQDQFIAMLGLQYQPLDFLVLRSGYNYGRSAIPADSLFASQLAIPIGEHHVGGGLGLSLGKNVRLDFSYLRTFSNTVTDTGVQGGGAGIGAFTRQSVHQMNTEIGLTF